MWSLSSCECDIDWLHMDIRAHKLASYNGVAWRLQVMSTRHDHEMGHGTH